MSIWIIIWLLISAVLIYFTVWTFVIVLKQKHTWQEFAKENKLRLKSAGMLTPARISGIYKGFSIYVFPCEHMVQDGRGVRKMTAIEVRLKRPIPVNGAIGNGIMASIIQDLTYPEEYKPKEKFWDHEFIIRTDNAKAVEQYLTEKRLKAVMRVGKIKNVSTIFVFEGDDTILRLDTSDPLHSKKKLASLIDKAIESARVLHIEETEAREIASTRKEHASVTLSDKTSGGLKLELEEDEPMTVSPVDTEATDDDGVSSGEENNKAGEADNEADHADKPVK